MFECNERRPSANKGWAVTIVRVAVKKYRLRSDRACEHVAASTQRAPRVCCAGGAWS